MLPLSASQSVSLDVLNNYNESIARFDACLHHLHGDWALLTMPSHAPLSLIHWGTQVRFCLSDGAQGYEAWGVVVARDADGQSHLSCDATRLHIEPNALRAAETADQTACHHMPVTEEPSVQETRGVREVTVRLYECHPFGDRRAGPRRWTRFGVRLAPLCEPLINDQPGQTDAKPGDAAPFALPELAAESPSTPSGSCWERGWAIDISAGGLRLRTYACLPLRQRFALQFWLPDARPNHAMTHANRFEVVGRVLRSQRTRSRGPLYESMMCFEQLSPRDGLALSGFLAAQSQIPCGQ